MSRSLVVQTSFLGDMILTTALLRALAVRGPVDVVATPANADLLAHHPAVRHVYRYDKRGTHSGVGGFRAVVQQARALDRSDVAYLAQGSVRSAALALAAGFERRVGFSTSAGRFLYTEQRAHVRDQHHAERLWRLAAGDDAAPPASTTIRPSLHPGAEEEDAVQRLLDANGHAGEPLLAIAPGSVWATKRWPHFAALSRRLAALGRVVVLGSAGDQPLAEAIGTEVFGHVIDATGRLSLLGSAALLRRARVLVTNDSAPLHLASAMDTPTVALFGPTVPAFGFGPLATAHRVAEVEMLSCRPCDAHGPRSCPLGHWRCMRDLTVAAVSQAVDEVRRAMDVSA
ncbi:MAG: glycosyltransferase family 9 protein [Gemmatimonadota bacterium]